MSAKTGAKRLTPQEVIYARDERAKGRLLSDIASELGVTEGCISLVCRGKNHKTIGGPRTRRKVKEQASPPEPAAISECPFGAPAFVPAFTADDSAETFTATRGEVA